MKLHAGYSHPVLRHYQTRACSPSIKNLIYPLFVLNGSSRCEPIHAMPGQSRRSVDLTVEYLRPLVKAGLSAVILFGVPSDIKKDNHGSGADHPENPVILAIPQLLQHFPDLLISVDICLCAYTDHGHCGVLTPSGHIDNEASIKRLGEMSAAMAKAGAHVVAPSDMMDGRVAAIKKALASVGLDSRVPVMSYSAKFASSFYGPFREAAASAPSFGDRQCYQLPPGAAGLARRALLRDIEEGADILMVKPGLPYLDIIKSAKDSCPDVPIAVYQVSGEYSMIIAAANQNVFEQKKAVLECLVSLHRAGADIILTYFVPQLLEWLKE